jgi:hypothetical protein
MHLRNLNDWRQHAFYFVLGVFFEDRNWTAAGVKNVEKSDFKISLIVWALYLGPLGLAASIIESFKAAKEKWLIKHVGSGKYEDDKVTEALCQRAACIGF